MTDQAGESVANRSASARTERGLDRRALLQAIVTIVAASKPFGFARSAESAGLDLGDFRNLIVALTGFAPRDPTLSEAFFDAFSGELAELGRLADIVLGRPPEEWDAAISEAKLDGLAQTIITAFYTGIVGEGAEAKVITYLNAFVWYALGYTKPPSQCDWDFGAWAYPPPLGRFEP
jgi:hypothetical protein